MLSEKSVNHELENSMMFGKVNRSWNEDEDSFLALERQCNMETKKEQLINANDTLLFDIEPPSELWNQTINQSDAIEDLDQSQNENNSKYDCDEEEEDGDETIEISPVKYIGLMRQSTIIEETSSQMYSYNRNGSSSTTKSSLYETASINETGKSFKSIDGLSLDSKSSKSVVDLLTENDRNEIECKTNEENGSKLNRDNAMTSPTDKQSLEAINSERQRRGTFAFKRANYTFFPDENLEPINESGSFSEIETNKNLIELETKSKNDDSIENEDQFNNTLERVDYFLEKGRQILEDTPIAKRNSHHHSLMETPLFSFKRKRLLNEMASIEMLPLAKRGPLIDFSSPEILHKMRLNKFSGK